MPKHIKLFLLVYVFTISCSNSETEVANQASLTVSNLQVNVQENSPLNTVLGTFIVVQENLLDPIEFSIVESSAQGALNINSQGQLLIADVMSFDFETNQSITGQISVRSGNLVKNAEFIINILDVDEQSDEPFISKWSLTNDNLTIKLPIYNGQINDQTEYNFTVDWGDGTSNQVTSYNDVNASHNYQEAGEKTITIHGLLKGFSFREIPDSRDLFIDIEQWGGLLIGNAGGNFSRCVNLMEFSASDAPLLSGVTNLESMFASATNFNGDLSNWDIDNVTSLRFMFSDAGSFNQQLSSWNVSSVTDMVGVFVNAVSFNQDISDWDTSNATLMTGAFAGAIEFNQDISDWNTSSVTDMEALFAGAIAFNQNVSNWDVGSVTEFRAMFRGATEFNQDISNWNTSGALDMGLMFLGATDFNQDISIWDVGNVTMMDSMFEGATTFNQDLSGWSTDNVIACDNFSLNSGLLEANLPSKGCFDN